MDKFSSDGRKRAFRASGAQGRVSLMSGRRGLVRCAPRDYALRQSARKHNVFSIKTNRSNQLV